MNGAVIVAAGLSSRMGDFKPLLPIGSISMAERIIYTLKAAAIDYIVVVTGHNAEVLENKLKNNGVVFIRNENYAETEMFDSAKLGLNYLKDKCKKILFTPVDIPLFSAEVVRRLLQSEAMIAVPVTDGKVGHPLMLNYCVLDKVLSYTGDIGLKGAVEESGYQRTLVEVEDRGILLDADTPSDYKDIVELHNQQLFRPSILVRLAKEAVFFEPSVALLLKQISYTGSVRHACQDINVSYSRGWKMLRTLEKELKYKVVKSNQGGPNGGNTELTEKGRSFLLSYEKYEAELNRYAKQCFGKYFRIE